MATTIPHAEVHWNLTRYCENNCSYCYSKFRGGTVDKTTDQYLAIVEKLQATRYKHHESIYWKLGGGEPLHFPSLNIILKKIKEQPSRVRLDTSGGETWFSITSVIDYIDEIKLTYHHNWQHRTVIDFIIEQCKEKNIALKMIIPLIPGLILESRALVAEFVSLGIDCTEQMLSNEDGSSIYSAQDINLIMNRSADWVEPVVVRDPNLPDPAYVDLRVVNNSDPVYTGMPCYAGVDWIYISQKGWPAYSGCGGRSAIGNVFDENWEAPSDAFPCNVNQCRNGQDRRKIRVIGS